jgi:5-hydroxyisourate hydrolase
VLAAGVTDLDGRVPQLVDDLDPGTYSMVFHPSSPFFTRVELQVELADGHHHLPLLVSPYGCVTYRGS